MFSLYPAYSAKSRPALQSLCELPISLIIRLPKIATKAYEFSSNFSTQLSSHSRPQLMCGYHRWNYQLHGHVSSPSFSIIGLASPQTGAPPFTAPFVTSRIALWPLHHDFRFQPCSCTRFEQNLSQIGCTIYTLAQIFRLEPQMFLIGSTSVCTSVTTHMLCKAIVQCSPNFL